MITNENCEQSCEMFSSHIIPEDQIRAVDTIPKTKKLKKKKEKRDKCLKSIVAVLLTTYQIGYVVS